MQAKMYKRRRHGGLWRKAGKENPLPCMKQAVAMGMQWYPISARIAAEPRFALFNGCRQSPMMPVGG